MTIEYEQCQGLCQLMFKHSEVCFHIYSGICLYFLINYTMCKHIYLVTINHKCKKDMYMQNRRVVNNTMRLYVGINIPHTSCMAAIRALGSYMYRYSRGSPREGGRALAARVPVHHTSLDVARYNSYLRVLVYVL